MILSGMNTMEGVPEVITWPTRILKISFDEGTRGALLALGIPVDPDLEFSAIHNGRVYLIVDSLVATMLRLPGWKLEIAGVDQEAVWRHLPAEITRPPGLWGKIQGGLILLNILLHAPGVNRALKEEALARNMARTRDLDRQVAAAQTDGALADLADPLLQHMTHLFKTHLLSSMIFTQSWTALEKVSQEVGVDPSLLVAGSGGIVSSRVTAMLYRLAAACADQGIALEAGAAWQQIQTNPATKKALAEFLESCGHRSFNEMEFAAPRFREDPDAVLSALRAQGLTDPQEAAEKVRQEGWSQVPEAKRQKVAKRAEEASRKAALREATKDAIVRLGDAYRKWCLQAAQTLPDPDTLWLMTIDEIVHWLREREPVAPETLDKRRAELETWRSLTPVETLYLDEESGAVHPLSVTEVEERHGVVRGTMVSRGTADRVSGRAVVALEPQVALQKIESFRAQGQTPILVTRVTNVAWTAAFGGIGGIVTEIGGVGSHAAIVAREYGLPAMVGAAQAVTLVPDGAAVELDCSRGELRWHT